MFRVVSYDKLKWLKNVIRSFSRDHFSDMEKRVQEAHEEVLRKILSSSSYVALADQEDEISEKMASRGLFLPKVENNLIQEGNCSSTFYHRIMDLHKSGNHIHFLIIDDDGNRVETQEEIQELCLRFYSGLLEGEVSLPGNVYSIRPLIMISFSS